MDLNKYEYLKYDWLYEYGTPVEYLESDGNQYINTGIKPNPSRTGTECIFSALNDSLRNQAIYGAREEITNAGSATNVFYNTSSTKALRLDVIGSDKLTSPIPLKQKITFKHSPLNKQVVVNNGVYNSTKVMYDRDLNVNYLIFGFTNVTEVDVNAFMRVYLWNITYDSLITHKFIPFIDNNGKPCLFDLINRKYFYNRGTGEFKTGGVISISNNSKKELMIMGLMKQKTKRETGYYILNTDTGERLDYTDTATLKAGINANKGNSILNGNVKVVNYPNSNGFTNMYGMFYQCYYIKTLDLSSFDTNGVTNMSSFFKECYNLTVLDISNFNTSEVSSTDSMFHTCGVKSLDLSNFVTTKLTGMGVMFYNCGALSYLDLSSFDVSAVTNTYSTFYNCINLTTCYARTQADCDILNSSSNKPANVNFVVKP